MKILTVVLIFAMMEGFPTVTPPAKASEQSIGDRGEAATNSEMTRAAKLAAMGMYAEAVTDSTAERFRSAAGMSAMPEGVRATEVTDPDQIAKWHQAAAVSRSPLRLPKGHTFQTVTDPDLKAAIDLADNMSSSPLRRSTVVTAPDLKAAIDLAANMSSSPLRSPTTPQAATGTNGNATATNEYIEYFVRRAKLRAAAASFMVVVLVVVGVTLLRMAARIKRNPKFVGEEKPYAICGATATSLGVIGLAFALYAVSDYMMARHNPVMYAATHMSEIMKP